MSWNNYKEWTLDKVVEAIPINGEVLYSARELLQKKYPQDNYRELISELEKLFANIEDYYNNQSFGSDSDIIDSGNNNKYYSLPDFTDEEDNFNTWSKMFSDPNQTFFGKKKSISESMNEDTFNMLAGIHQMYLREISLLEELDRKANEYANENTNSIDPVILKGKYQDWLEQFRTLSHAHQDKMTFEAKTVEDLLRDLENINNNQQQDNNDNGDKPLPSGNSNLVTYGIYGVIVVTILGFLYLLKIWLFPTLF